MEKETSLQDIVKNDYQEKTIIDINIPENKIGLASEHRGFKLKQKLTKYLTKKGYTVIDYGCDDKASDDYPEYGIALKNELVKFMPLFYKWDSRATIFPNLGLVRGKIIALECSPIEYKFYEFDNKIWAQTWHDNKFIDLQDLWDGPSIEDKKQAIKNNFTAKISNKLFLNHISATNGNLGYPDSYANILNSYFLSLCNETEYKNGVQMMDFIDEKLSKQCVDSNFQL